MIYSSNFQNNDIFEANSNENQFGDYRSHIYEASKTNQFLDLSY